MDTVKTATGKEFESDYVALIPRPEMLFIRICSGNVGDIANVFTSPAETIQLWHGENYFVGYTKFIGLIPETGAYKICLERSNV